jgi:glutamate synthase domain-containing protein 3
METLSETTVEIDLADKTLRELNSELHNPTATHYKVLNPRGGHSVAVGVKDPIDVEIEGDVGYFCAGMHQRGTITINGMAGPGVGENMMSGVVHVKGHASQSAAATAHGGLLVVEGNASTRCGISLKGGDIVVKGNMGSKAAFMAQAGRIVVCGDVGEDLGDSIFEARLYVRGKVGSLGADCIEKEMRDEHREELVQLLKDAGMEDEANDDAYVDSFTRYGSARTLYNF